MSASIRAGACRCKCNTVCLFSLGLDGFQPGAELIVPTIDVDDLALGGSGIRGGIPGGLAAAATAAPGQQRSDGSDGHRAGK